MQNVSHDWIKVKTTEDVTKEPNPWYAFVVEWLSTFANCMISLAWHPCPFTRFNQGNNASLVQSTVHFKSVLPVKVRIRMNPHWFLVGWIRIRMGNADLGSGWAKKTHIKEKLKKVKKCIFLRAGFSLLKDGGFSCSLYVSHGALGQLYCLFCKN